MRAYWHYIKVRPISIETAIYPLRYNVYMTVDLLVLLKSTNQTIFSIEANNMRRPGIEPGSAAWKATMLTFAQPMLTINDVFLS